MNEKPCCVICGSEKDVEPRRDPKDVYLTGNKDLRLLCPWCAGVGEEIYG
jgi:hypothetical protein